MRRTFKILLLIIIAVCSIIIAKKLYLYYIDDKLYSDLRDFKSSEAINSETNIDEEKLLDINNEYKLWITIDNTNIDYPVVQGKDNEFYLNHDFYKNQSISGSIFVDSNNDILKDKNIVIYGHNMRNGTMFYEINKFKERDFFENNYINIIRNNKISKYKVFSVYIVSSQETSFMLGSSNNKEYNEYIKTLKEKSLFKNELELKETNNIITLMTCSYEFSDARTVVHAIEVTR